MKIRAYERPWPPAPGWLIFLKGWEKRKRGIKFKTKIKISDKLY
jgi:hypothetical protein